MSLSKPERYPADGPAAKRTKTASVWGRALRILGDSRCGIEVWTCKDAIVGLDTANSFRVFAGNGKSEYSLRLRIAELDLLLDHLVDGCRAFKYDNDDLSRSFTCQPMRFKNGTKGVALELHLRSDCAPPYKFKLFLDRRDIEALLKANAMLREILAFAFCERFLDDVCHAVAMAWTAYQESKWDPAEHLDGEARRLISRLATLMDFDAPADLLFKGVTEMLTTKEVPDETVKTLSGTFLLILQTM